ncbi:MAG: hypothetical protein K2J15_03225 [Muribaculaceae bacterium]|nr:hypothetical protein [Muribaculaceae bacterium]
MKSIFFVAMLIIETISTLVESKNTMQIMSSAIGDASLFLSLPMSADNGK